MIILLYDYLIILLYSIICGTEVILLYYHIIRFLYSYTTILYYMWGGNYISILLYDYYIIILSYHDYIMII